jgi:hypothetical protein
MSEMLLSAEETYYELPWTPLQYGIASMVVFTVLLLAVTRMNKDR